MLPALVQSCIKHKEKPISIKQNLEASGPLFWMVIPCLVIIIQYMKYFSNLEVASLTSCPSGKKGCIIETPPKQPGKVPPQYLSPKGSVPSV